MQIPVLIGSMSFLLLFTVLISGCAYYNYMYNANKYYEAGEKERRSQKTEDLKAAKKGSSSNYNKCIEAAGRMLQYYPNSRWEDDALLLIAKAYYHSGKFRPSIRKIDELESKYPNSDLLGEGWLWKGKSLLMVSQQDSAAQIFTRLFDSDVSREIKAEATIALGENYFLNDEWEKAVELFNNVIEYDPNDKLLKNRAWILIGESLDRLERHSEAVELYDSILSKKINRRFRFDINFNRSVSLRKSGAYKEAYQAFEELLTDAAFIAEFPAIELQSCLCLIEMEQIDDAVSRLEELTESEKKGSVAAEAYYQLGLIKWTRFNDISGALKAFDAVGSADKSHSVRLEADSLRSEMETLYSSWRMIEFLNSQLVIIDSAKAGQNDLFPRDTLFVDSLKIIINVGKKEEKGKRKSRRSRSRRKDMDPEREEEKAKDVINADSTAVTKSDSTSILDSLQLHELHENRNLQLNSALFEIAGFHLFERNDPDSSEYYITKTLNRDISEDIWVKSTATLAHIYHQRGSKIQHDSLYSEILNRVTEGDFAERARMILGQQKQLVLTPVDSAFLSAETVWMDSLNIEQAVFDYNRIIEMSDSASEQRARALFAAAYIFWKELDRDSLAIRYYNMLVEEFPGTDYADFAEEHLEAANQRLKETESDPEGGVDPLPQEEDLFEGRGSRLIDFSNEEVDNRIYLPDEVDILPVMTTSSTLFQNYLRSYYPLPAQIEGKLGRVEVEFVVRHNNRLTDIQIISEEPEGYEFDIATEAIMHELKFRAGRLRGKPVNVKMKQKLLFEPENQD